ncbi:MAG: signal recognition particle-docking protein FtsY [Candidatus Altiarchaeota archaeon]|nr:signal recognition particle-docking protein FtsY [Candidatus Altiarchaeota archaeon]
MFNILKEKIKSFIGRVGEAEESKELKPELSAATKIRSAVTGKVKLTQADLESLLYELHLDLLQSDVAMQTADDIVAEIKKSLVGSEVEKDKVQEFVKGMIHKALEDTVAPGEGLDIVERIRNSQKPFKIVFLGVNGTGKTTTMAKVARYLMDNNITVVLAAGDTFRAGAIEQLQKHAGNVGLKVITHQKSADSAAVIYDAVEHAKAKNIDVVLADTAGRMQTNVNLMDELKKIVRVNKPDLRVFVGDALTGNDAVEQARKFNQEVGIDAVILTKIDADAKGGSALSIAHEIKKPIIFVGVGQGYADLKPFDKKWFVDSII